VNSTTCLLGLALVTGSAALAADPIALGNRRELFVDEHLIAKLVGVTRLLHRPIAREVAIVHDAPWEGNISYYHTVFQDEGKYRMYYRGGHSGKRVSYPAANKHQLVCYAESNNGLHWTKPNLGLHEFNGSKENNIMWTGIGVHNFVPFKDANPDCVPEAKYKAIGHGKGGLYAFRSADAIRWELIRDTPVITKGAFDSQNLAFYDSVRGRYVDFHRGFKDGVRAIMTCTSPDFLNWTEPEWIEISDGRKEHLYTNQTTPYHRAPHIFMAFPKRFLPSRNPTGHPLSGASDIVFMTSRDGLTFDRWSDAFVRPGLQSERWVNRNNFVNWGIVETASGIQGTPDLLTWYSVEGYYQGDDCQMRRYTLRKDGFVSVRAPLRGGELLTKPLTFSVPARNTPRTEYPQRAAAIRYETKNPIRGNGSLEFQRPAILHLGDTTNLGKQATLGVVVRDVPAGLRRLFSTYNGSTTAPDELYFDINSGGIIQKINGYSIRFNYDGVLTGARFEDIGDWSAAKLPGKIHHIAATWDDGRVTLYFDGKQVAVGGKPGAGDLMFKLGDLRFGEDYPPTSIANEPFMGAADDILVLRRKLSLDELKRWVKGDFGVFESTDAGVLLTMDGEHYPLADKLMLDGASTVVGPVEDEPFQVGLFVNYATSAAGSLRCEIQDENGKVIPGFSMAECDEAVGDAIEFPMRWKGSAELNSLAGRSIRLRFELKDTDIYAMRFGK
jgi:hypothetical protein